LILRACRLDTHNDDVHFPFESGDDSAAHVGRVYIDFLQYFLRLLVAELAYLKCCPGSRYAIRMSGPRLRAYTGTSSAVSGSSADETIRIPILQSRIQHFLFEHNY
jgi:hypothetical protein